MYSMLKRVFVLFVTTIATQSYCLVRLRPKYHITQQQSLLPTYCSSVPSQQEPYSDKNEFGKAITKFKANRRTKWWEYGAIYLLSYLLANSSPNRNECMKHVHIGMNFGNFVSLTKEMLRGADVRGIRELIVDLLKSLMPEKVRSFFQEKYKETPKYLCEASSEWLTFGLLDWLVGPTSRFYVPITQSDGQKEEWLSGVKLQECRYLVESGCKATCLHLCKGPTQEFFNKELQVPMTMIPNFEDCSCEMLFGVPAPPETEDKAYGEPCFSSCSMARLEAKKAWRISKRGVDDPAPDSNSFQKCS